MSGFYLLTVCNHFKKFFSHKYSSFPSKDIFLVSYSVPTLYRNISINIHIGSLIIRKYQFFERSTVYYRNRSSSRLRLRSTVVDNQKISGLWSFKYSLDTFEIIHTLSYPLINWKCVLVMKRSKKKVHGEQNWRAIKFVIFWKNNKAPLLMFDSRSTVFSSQLALNIVLNPHTENFDTMLGILYRYIIFKSCSTKISRNIFVLDG